jgi:hypothetical protein
VEAVRAEYERLAAEQGENSRAAEDMLIKLNRETETLNKMQVELAGTEDNLQAMAEGEQEAGDAAEEMGGKIDDGSTKTSNFRGVISGLGVAAGGAVGGMAALAAAGVAAAAGIFKLLLGASDAAGELVDLSAQTGISTTRLQELSYVGDQVGTSLDTITGAQTKLIRSMATAQEQKEKFDEALASGAEEDEIENVGDMQIAFNKLGVSFVDSTGQLRDQQVVFQELIDALGRVENPVERDALAMEIFGKSAQELNPLIKAGSDELARLSQEAHDVGAVVAEDTVSGLEAFGDTMTSIKAGVRGILGTLVAQFLPVFQQVATALQNLFKSEAFKTRLAEITKLISGFVGLISTVIGQLLSGDLSGALASLFGADRADDILAIIQIISSFLQDTLIPFVTTHAEEIKAALIGIGAALAAAGIVTAIVSIVSAIVAAVNPITLVILAIVAAVGLLSAAWTGNWGGIRDTVTNFWEGTLKPAFEALRTWLATNIPIAIQALSNIWTGTLLPAIQAVWGFLSGTLFPLLQAVSEFIGAVFSLVLRALAGFWQNILLPALEAVWGFLDRNILPIFRTVGDYLSKTLQPIIETFGGFLNENLLPAFNGINGAIQKLIDWLRQMAEKIKSIELPWWLTPGSPTPWEVGLVGINDALSDLNKQLPAMARGLDAIGLSGAVAVSNVRSNNESYAFYAPVVIQESGPGNLAETLKARRF